MLHIGPHKTGTTALQHAMRLAREDLLAQGVRLAGRGAGDGDGARYGLGLRTNREEAEGKEAWERIKADLADSSTPRRIFSREAFANAVLVFILPPSWEELRSRLERRGEDTPEVIEVRLKNAAEEMAQVSKFDFVIINELFERALFDLKAVVHAQRLKYAAQRRARADTFQSLNIT